MKHLMTTPLAAMLAEGTVTASPPDTLGFGLGNKQVTRGIAEQTSIGSGGIHDKRAMTPADVLGIGAVGCRQKKTMAPEGARRGSTAKAGSFAQFDRLAQSLGNIGADTLDHDEASANTSAVEQS